MRTCALLVLLGLCPKLKYPPLCGGIFIAPRLPLFTVNPSVNPPYGVLPAPRSGSLLVLPPTKSCPRLWGKWHEVPKGVRLKTAECRELFPLSFAYAQQLPRFTVAPFGAVQTRRTVPYPFAERSFQWGYGGCRGPKGRNRNLPWPPCKKGYKETPFSFVYLNPSVTAYAVPAPRRGEPFGALYNSNIATAGRQ